MKNEFLRFNVNRLIAVMLIVLLHATAGWAQELQVSGKVTSADDNSSLPGVNVLVKGTTNGTVTDSDGNYAISVPQNATLVFTFIGYTPTEVVVGGRTTIDVGMEADIQQLSEVVVVGYGTVKKSDVTGSIVSVGSEELRARPVANALEALQGKAAGVDITSNERPGELGQVRIRGTRSLLATSDPLYVVDGIPLMSGGIENLNTLDIESIDVLKDASATAIYGSRGANGVILVTTKRGKAGQMTMNYSGSLTVENIQDLSPMMDADEYITWRRWSYYYRDPNNYPRGDEPTQDNDFAIFLGANDPFAWANIMKGWEGGNWDGSKVKTTDWLGMVTQTAVTQNHTISASGGNDKVRAFGSFGYLDNEGTMKGQSFKRYSTKLSVDLTPKEWFEMGVSINASYGVQQYGQSTTGGQVSGPNSIYAGARGVFPYAVPYDDNGERIQSPGGDDYVRTIVDEWKLSENQRTTIRALGSFYAQVNILPGLRYRVNFGPDFRQYQNGIFIDEKSVVRVGNPSYASLTNETDFSWTLDNLIYYDKTIGKHKIGGTLLQTSSSRNRNWSNINGTDVPYTKQKWNALGAIPLESLRGYSSNLEEQQLLSYMGRITYGLSDKYLLTLSGRWDGASQLADGNKWSFFPSAALAWRVTEEDWMQNTTWLDQLKVRVGVGTTGNAAIRPYMTKGGIHSMFYPYGGTIAQGYAPSEFQISADAIMANHALSWERTTQYNFGIDFSVLNSRLTGTVDVYTSRTTDLLQEMSISPINSYTTTYANIGETKNNGIDITLNSVNVKTGDFTWETSLNAAWQKNEIVSLANGKSDDIGNLWFIGESLGVVYGFDSDGLWQEGDADEMALFNANDRNFSAGMSRPVDQNGDKIIDARDRVVIGHTQPRWTLGLNNMFRYKNFDLSVFVYGRFDYTVNTGGEFQGGRYTQRDIDYYNENNKNAEYQKPIYDVAGGDPFFNILGYRSGSFLKIRNINLGYRLPESVIEKLKINSLRLYVQARNPGMLYSKVDFLDMDTGLSTWNRGFVFGLDAQF
ncbi:MAG TPA: TonB-dependent receptor [Ohtaekwangia sp.]|nr:TonB-dependent receptor [Ohtaekwangia sp.]